MKKTSGELTHLILLDSYKSSWETAITKKLNELGFNKDAILKLDVDKAKFTIKQKILDIEGQMETASFPKHIVVSDQVLVSSPAPYLFHVTLPKFRRALTLARFNMLPTAVLEGRFKKIPYELRLCHCDLGAIETTEHVLLYCQFYRDVRNQLIYPIINKFPGNTDLFYLRLLLDSRDPSMIHKVAKFCYIVCKVRPQLVNENFTAA